MSTKSIDKRLFIIALICVAEISGLVMTRPSELSTTSEEWIAFKLKYNKSYTTKEEDEMRLGNYLNSKAQIEDLRKRDKKNITIFALNKFADFTQEEWRRLSGAKYNKSYTTKEEDEMRLGIYLQTKLEIERLGKETNNTATYGINKFADLTREELRRSTGVARRSARGACRTDSATRYKNRSVIVHQKENRLGMQVYGENPVFVACVRENSAAWKTGVQRSDRIIEINGTLVESYPYQRVIQMIKDSGPYINLTLSSRISYSGYKVSRFCN